MADFFRTGAAKPGEAALAEALRRCAARAQAIGLAEIASDLRAVRKALMMRAHREMVAPAAGKSMETGANASLHCRDAIA